MSEANDVVYYIAQIGHEIRTPLNAIQGFGSLLMDETFGELNDKQKLYLGKMLFSSDKLLEITNQILDWAKLETGQVVLNIEKIPMYYLAKEVEELLSLKAKEKGIKFHINIDSSIYVEGDLLRLREVMMNLIYNAIKFSNDQGVIEVEAIQNDNQMLITITDFGRGMEEEQAERLFQPFQRGEERKGDEKGTGLGLWICRSIIELHQGRIWVKSKYNQGSTFYITLPNQQKI